MTQIPKVDMQSSPVRWYGCHTNVRTDTCQGESCSIHTSLDAVRDHCYDIKGPFSVLTTSYYCKTHKKAINFADLGPFPPTIVPLLDGELEPLLIMPRTIMTRNLWDKIVTMFIVSRSVGCIIYFRHQSCMFWFSNPAYFSSAIHHRISAIHHTLQQQKHNPTALSPN